MPTSKKRLNLTLPEDLGEMLVGFAKRDNMPVARKAIELIETAIELEEDAIWAQIAEERDQPGVKYISHEDAWK